MKWLPKDLREVMAKIAAEYAPGCDAALMGECAGCRADTVIEARRGGALLCSACEDATMDRRWCRVKKPGYEGNPRRALVEPECEPHHQYPPDPADPFFGRSAHWHPRTGLSVIMGLGRGLAVGKIIDVLTDDSGGPAAIVAVERLTAFYGRSERTVNWDPEGDGR